MRLLWSSRKPRPDQSVPASSSQCKGKRAVIGTKVADLQHARKAFKKRSMQPKPNPLCVYVGNLPNDVTEEEISTLFTQVNDEPIVSLRVSQGLATHTPIPDHHVPGRIFDDAQYACITFTNAASCKKALEMHNLIFRQHTLIVTTEVTDLPEFDHIRTFRISLIQGQKGYAQPAGRQLRAQPTLVLFPEAPKNVSSGGVCSLDDIIPE